MRRNTVTLRKWMYSPMAIGLVLLGSTLAIAFSSGPPNERTGAPGEGNCTGCHNQFALNSGNGTVTITAPSSYIAGQTYVIEIDLEDTDQQRWGFEITALDENDQPAGTLGVVEAARTQKSTATNGREYVKHTSTGTDAGTADAAPGWTVEWMAIDVSGPVTFYAAGNAANWGDGNQGDYIYTTSATVAEEVVACCTGIRGNVDNDPMDQITLGDLTVLIDHLFVSFGDLECWEEANVDASLPEGPASISLGDLTVLIDHLFVSFEDPPACP